MVIYTAGYAAIRPHSGMQTPILLLLRMGANIKFCNASNTYPVRYLLCHRKEEESGRARCRCSVFVGGVTGIPKVRLCLPSLLCSSSRSNMTWTYWLTDAVQHPAIKSLSRSPQLRRVADLESENPCRDRRSWIDIRCVFN
jgi:hypothetical protein